MHSARQRRLANSRHATLHLCIITRFDLRQTVPTMAGWHGSRNRRRKANIELDTQGRQGTAHGRHSRTLVLVHITDQPIDIQFAMKHVTSPQAGAVVTFVGTTREFTGDKQTRFLEYECYQPMAERKLAELESEARRRWPLTECVLIHRTGKLELCEASVLVAVSSPHRKDAFQAAQWLMDSIKQDVPVWKKEHWKDGTSQWLHPGVPASPTS